MPRPSAAHLPSLAILFALYGADTRADSVQSKCPNLEKCAHAVAELTGTKYVFDAAPLANAKVSATANLELTKENAEEVFTQMLDQSGYSRLPLRDEKTYTIIRQRDARDSALPVYEADWRNVPDFPRTWDLATVRYRAQTPAMVEDLARNARSFLPANARAIPYEASGHLLFTAPIPILRSVLNHTRTLDVKVSPDALQKMKRERERRQERNARLEPAAERSSPAASSNPTTAPKNR